jgi:small basic protein
MFICLIWLLHLLAMFNSQMDLSSYVSCFHVLELLLFIAVIITYGIYLSYMLVLFGIRMFNIFKYIGSMSLISLKIQQKLRSCVVVVYYYSYVPQLLCLRHVCALL